MSYKIFGVMSFKFCSHAWGQGHIHWKECWCSVSMVDIWGDWDFQQCSVNASSQRVPPTDPTPQAPARTSDIPLEACPRLQWRLKMVERVLPCETDHTRKTGPLGGPLKSCHHWQLPTLPINIACKMNTSFFRTTIDLSRSDFTSPRQE